MKPGYVSPHRLATLPRNNRKQQTAHFLEAIAAILDDFFTENWQR
jgi:hypothetical protein